MRINSLLYLRGMQAASHLLMIRPVRFDFNAQTATSNSFQKGSVNPETTQEKALKEFDAMVDLLRSKKIEVTVIEDTPEPHTPDSIFPNNWISFHEDGSIALYPMQAENRRWERRKDIPEMLGNKLDVRKIFDYSGSESENKFLEGTGSMVLDRNKRVCYACLSPRTHPELLAQFCRDFDYRLLPFKAVDSKGEPIYHTNVVMCVASQFMVICFDCIPDERERAIIKASTNKEIIPISFEQLDHFAGNMLEVQNKEGKRYLVMSEQAYLSLRPEQVAALEKYDDILHSTLYTIEANGGGSARCMMAEVFLPEKSRNGL